MYIFFWKKSYIYVMKPKNVFFSHQICNIFNITSFIFCQADSIIGKAKWWRISIGRKWLAFYKGLKAHTFALYNLFFCLPDTVLYSLQLAFFPLYFQAVDVVGQAGKPKTITGFQTHTTPVLLAYGERAELATEECILSIHIVL